MGAHQLLQQAKRLGKTVAIISEGPHDAQDQTLEQLGFTPYVDHLITSSRYQRSKTAGLFQVALERLQIAPTQLLYVGDSPTRDYLPAASLGIHAFLVAAPGRTPEATIPSIELPQLATWLAQHKPETPEDPLDRRKPIKRCADEPNRITMRPCASAWLSVQPSWRSPKLTPLALPAGG